MIYSSFKDLRLSKLGFGAMRLPLQGDGKTIDAATVKEMVACAMEHGVNYYDTAFPYHAGFSEIVLGEALKAYPRDTWYLADKFPGHQHHLGMTPAEVFEQQLEKCGVDYFDFYLLHNVCENSLDNYLDPSKGIVDYFVEQRRLGRIRHLGFSSHADLDALQTFLDSPYGAEMEFCQIQLNYLDWTLQKAKEKCKILNDRGLPIWVMEPVRGGRLAALGDEADAALRVLRPDESVAAWAFRWLQSVPGVTVILSGMSSPEQMADNVRTFEAERPLSEAEEAVLMDAVAPLRSRVPCTACRYCCDGCPMELDIPMLIAAYNDLSLGFNFTPMMRLEALPEEKRPSACLSCGACAEICPQGIPIPDVLAGLSERYDSMPKWSDICRQRAEEAARLNQNK
jgi:hypothetical protein